MAIRKLTTQSGLAAGNLKAKSLKKGTAPIAQALNKKPGSLFDQLTGEISKKPKINVAGVVRDKNSIDFLTPPKPPKVSYNDGKVALGPTFGPPKQKAPKVGAGAPVQMKSEKIVRHYSSPAKQKSVRLGMSY